MVIINQTNRSRFRLTNHSQGSKGRQGARQQEKNKRGKARCLCYCSLRKTRTERRSNKTKRRTTNPLLNTYLLSYFCFYRLNIFCIYIIGKYPIFYGVKVRNKNRNKQTNTVLFYCRIKLFSTAKNHYKPKHQYRITYTTNLHSLLASFLPNTQTKREKIGVFVSSINKNKGRGCTLSTLYFSLFFLFSCIMQAPNTTHIHIYICAIYMCVVRYTDKHGVFFFHSFTLFRFFV